MPFPDLFNPAEKIFEMGEVSPWHKERASDIFFSVSRSPTSRMRTSGMMRLRLSTHNLSRKIASARMEQRTMGNMNTPPFTIRSITGVSPKVKLRFSGPENDERFYFDLLRVNLLYLKGSFVPEKRSSRSRIRNFK
jgi:hypothetical protein